MSDSDSTVKARESGFETLMPWTATSFGVAATKGNRDDVVSSFVRMRIRQWKGSGKELQELARIAGFAKSTPSQVLIGTGVADKTGPKFAKAFGYASYEALRTAAWEWRRSQAEDSDGGPPVITEAMNQAAELVIGMGQGTQAQVDTIFAALAHSRFRERDRDWWVQTLLAELARDREMLREDKDQREGIYAAQRLAREAHKVRRPKPKGEPPTPTGTTPKGPYSKDGAPADGAADPGAGEPAPLAKRRAAGRR